MVNYDPESGCFQISSLNPEKMAIISIYQQKLAEILHLAIEDLYYAQKGTRPKTMYEIGLVYWYGQHAMPKPTITTYRDGFERLYKKEDFLKLSADKVATIAKIFQYLGGITTAMLSAALLKIGELPDYQETPLLHFRDRYRGIHRQVVNRLVDYFYPEILETKKNLFLEKVS